MVLCWRSFPKFLFEPDNKGLSLFGAVLESACDVLGKLIYNHKPPKFFLEERPFLN
jgi:hypothetical protein